jgi:transposase
MTCLLPPGQCHAAAVGVPLRRQSAVKRHGPGRPKRHPIRLISDKGNSRRASRQYLRPPGLRLTIARQRGESRPGPCVRTLYRPRNAIARLINRLKQFRRVATRAEERAANDQAMRLIAAIRLWS